MKKTQFNILACMIIVAFFGITIQSCNKEEAPGPGADKSLDQETVFTIAKSLSFDEKGLPVRSLKKSSVKEIKDYLTIRDDNDEDLFHIINYKEGGWVIMSANKKVDPILAYSEDSYFPIYSLSAGNIEDNEDIPLGVRDWFYSTKTGTEEKIASEESDLSIESQWDELIQPNLIIPPDDPPCEDQIYKVDNFMTTTWGQGCGYNTFFSTKYCEDGLPCGRFRTGPAATALAQIAKYYEYPPRYDYARMPKVLYSNGSTNFPLCTLFKNCATYAQTYFACERSYSVPVDAVHALINRLDYSSSVVIHTYYAPSDYPAVLSEIAARRPVIFYGETAYGDSHMWLCTGFLRGILCSGYSYTYFYMNWGWNGDFNGNYGFGTFNVDGKRYTQERKYITGIKP